MSLTLVWWPGGCVGDGIRWSGSGCLIDETGAGSGCFELVVDDDGTQSPAGVS